MKDAEKKTKKDDEWMPKRPPPPSVRLSTAADPPREVPYKGRTTLFDWCVISFESASWDPEFLGPGAVVKRD